MPVFISSYFFYGKTTIGQVQIKDLPYSHMFNRTGSSAGATTILIHDSYKQEAPTELW